MRKGKNKKSKTLSRRKRMIINRVGIIFFFLGFLGLIFFGIFSILKTFFTVKNIYADNVTCYDQETIINSCKIQKGDIIFFVDSKKSEDNIYSALSYIDSAKVNKCLPNTIKIEVNIATPYFNLWDNQEYLIISKNSKLLEKREDALPEIPCIKGMKFCIGENNDIIYENKLLKDLSDTIFQSFVDNDLFALKEIDISDENNIQLYYADKLQINFGNKNDIDYKVKTAKEIIFNKLKADDIGILDLSKLSINNKSYFKVLNRN